MKSRALDILWALTPERLQVLLAIATRGEHFQAQLEAHRTATGWSATSGTGAAAAPPYRIEGGVAVISITGVLMRHGGMLADVSGATSYDAIRASLQAALKDPECRAILLVVDSPGGEANGCGELAGEIRAADAQKPVLSYVEGNGCSGGYWLASAARRILCAPTAFLGSIGVRSAVIDDSEADKKEGIRRIEIISSQSPGKRGSPVDDDVIARAQTRADDLAQVFIDSVAAYRGVTADKVIADYGTGDHMIGANKAVRAGLADALSTYQGALLEAQHLAGPAPAAASPSPLQQRAGAPATRRMIMTKGTLAERLTALAAEESLSAEVRAELAGLAAKANEQGAELLKVKGDLVTASSRADRADYEELLRQAKADDDTEHARKVTSPAQEQKVRELFTSSADLAKHLAAAQPAPKLGTLRPAAEPTAAEAQRREFLLNQRGYGMAGGGAK